MLLIAHDALKLALMLVGDHILILFVCVELKVGSLIFTEYCLRQHRLAIRLCGCRHKGVILWRCWVLRILLWLLVGKSWQEIKNLASLSRQDILRPLHQISSICSSIKGRGSLNRWVGSCGLTVAISSSVRGWCLLNKLYLVCLKFGTAGLGFVSILIRVLGCLSSVKSSWSNLFADTLLRASPTAASSILNLLVEVTWAVQCH